ncbi:hypothetical protein D3C73_1646580 [compost metagenome]
MRQDFFGEKKIWINFIIIRPDIHSIEKHKKRLMYDSYKFRGDAKNESKSICR